MWKTIACTRLTPLRLHLLQYQGSLVREKEKLDQKQSSVFCTQNQREVLIPVRNIHSCNTLQSASVFECPLLGLHESGSAVDVSVRTILP